MCACVSARARLSVWMRASSISHLSLIDFVVVVAVSVHAQRSFNLPLCCGCVCRCGARARERWNAGPYVCRYMISFSALLSFRIQFAFKIIQHFQHAQLIHTPNRNADPANAHKCCIQLTQHIECVNEKHRIQAHKHERSRKQKR